MPGLPLKSLCASYPAPTSFFSYAQGKQKKLVKKLAQNTSFKQVSLHNFMGHNEVRQVEQVERKCF